MNIKNFILPIVVILGSGLLAVLVYDHLERGKADADEPVETIDDPLWYRSRPLEERLAGLQKRLSLMSSTAVSAAEVGPIKDEIALLCRDDRIVDEVVRLYRERKDLNSGELSAFMEVFARVKHPKFRPLVAEGLGREEFDVRLNALDAAITQGDVGSVRELAGVIDQSSGYEALRLLDALAATGGDLALDRVVRAIRVADHDGALRAINISVVYGMRSATPAFEARLNDPDLEVALTAAYGLAAFGSSLGVDRLRTVAGDPLAPDPLRAQAVQFLASLPTARDHLPLLATLSRGDAANTAFEAKVAAIRMGEAEVLRRLEEDLRGTRSVARTEAITILACTGREEDLRRLESLGRSLESDEIRSLLSGLGRGRCPAAARFLVELLDREPALEGEIIGRFHDLGAEGLAALRDLLSRRPEGERFGHLVAAVASFDSRDAMNLLESLDGSRLDRRMWLWWRNNIRNLELRLLKG